MTTVIKFFGYAKIGSTRPDQKHKNTKKRLGSAVKIRVGRETLNTFFFGLNSYTSVEGTSYPSGAQEFTPSFQ
jgi:hypothetical protein